MGYFGNVPLQILPTVCSYIPVRDLLNLSITSVKMKQVLDSDAFWTNRLIRPGSGNFH